MHRKLYFISSKYYFYYFDFDFFTGNWQLCFLYENLQNIQNCYISNASILHFSWFAFDLTWSESKNKRAS